MEGESADERGAGLLNPPGPDSRRRDEQSTAAGQHVPRRTSGKTSPQGHAVAVTTQEASDRSRRSSVRPDPAALPDPTDRGGPSIHASGQAQRRGYLELSSWGHNHFLKLDGSSSRRGNAACGSTSLPEVKSCRKEAATAPLPY